MVFVATKIMIRNIFPTGPNLFEPDRAARHAESSSTYSPVSSVLRHGIHVFLIGHRNSFFLQQHGIFGLGYPETLEPQSQAASHSSMLRSLTLKEELHDN